MSSTTRRGLLGGALAAAAAPVVAARAPRHARPGSCRRSSASCAGAGRLRSPRRPAAHRGRARAAAARSRYRRGGKRRIVDVGGHPVEVAISPGGRLAAVTTGFWDEPGLALVDLHGKPLGEADRRRPRAVRSRIHRRRRAPARHRRRGGGRDPGHRRPTAARSWPARALGACPRGIAPRPATTAPGSRSTAPPRRSSSTRGPAGHCAGSGPRRSPTASRSRATAGACSSPTAAATPTGSARSRSRRQGPPSQGRPAAERGRVSPATGAWSSRSAARAGSPSISTGGRVRPARDRRRPARPRARRRPRLDGGRADGQGRGGAPVSASTARELLRDGARGAAALGLAGAAGGALASAASAAPGKRPNVLILMTDQERHQDRLPDDLPTPVRCWLDENGTRIDRFHSSSMACSPSRACFWTGMYAPQQGVYGTFVVGTQFTMDPSIPTIGDLFKELGYRTAFFGKWHLSLPGRAADQPRGRARHAPGATAAAATASTTRAISPPSDVGGYNDGYTNDPIWTGQATSLPARARRRRAAVAVRAQPAQPARHPVLPARVPGRLQAARLRRRAGALVRGRADARRQAVGPQQVPRRRRDHRRHAGDQLGRPRVLARTAQHLLRPDRRHRRDARRGDQGGDRRRRPRRHGDRPHRRPRRARLRPPDAEQGDDDLRRAEPDPVHGRLPEAVPARAALAGARRGCRPGPDAARDRGRAKPGEALALASRRQPRLGARGPRLARTARLDPLPDRRVPDHQRRHGRADARATSARSTTAATSSPATSRSPSSISPGSSSSKSRSTRCTTPGTTRTRSATWPTTRPTRSWRRRCSPGSASASGRSTGPVELPAYGEKPLITQDPRAAEPRARPRAIPNPWLGAQARQLPGRPVRAARPAALPLRGRRLPQALSARPRQARRRPRPLLLRARAARRRRTRHADPHQPAPRARPRPPGPARARSTWST